MLHTLLNAVGEGRQHHQRNVRIFHLHIVGNVERVAVVGTRHTDDQVVGSLFQLRPGSLRRGDLGEAGRIAEAEIHVLIENLFVDASVVLQHERIIRVGHQQDIEDAFGHQADKLRVLEIKLVQC